MTSQEWNVAVGALMAATGFAAWAMVLLIDPHRHPIGAPIMTLLSLGMLLVSGLSLLHESWWVGVFAAANRVIVAGSGLRALWNLHRDARSARHES